MPDDQAQRLQRVVIRRLDDLHGLKSIACLHELLRLEALLHINVCGND